MKSLWENMSLPKVLKTVIDYHDSSFKLVFSLSHHEQHNVAAETYTWQTVQIYSRLAECKGSLLSEPSAISAVWDVTTAWPVGSLSVAAEAHVMLPVLPRYRPTTHVSVVSTGMHVAVSQCTQCIQCI